MKNALPKIEGIYDIQPPLPASLNNIELFIIIFVASVLTVLLFYISRKIFNSKRNRLKRKIRQLQISYSEKSIDAHDTVYLLSDFLRQGIGISHLSSQVVLPGKIRKYQARWTKFNNNLSLLRYQKNDTTNPELNTIFMESLFWLRIWP